VKTCCKFMSQHRRLCGKKATFVDRTGRFFCLVHARIPSNRSGRGLGGLRDDIKVIPPEEHHR